MSRKSAAASRAASYWPSRSLVCDLAAGAAGRRDQPVAVGREQLAVHPGLVEVALEAGERGHPEEVVHAARGAGEQRHVGVGARARDVVLAALAPAHPGAVLPRRARSDVCLDADDRLDAVLLRLLPELVRPEDVPVVRRRDRGHPHPRGLGEEVVDLGGTVEHRVLGVHVEVHERVAARGRAGRHGAPPGHGRRARAGTTAGCRRLPAGAGRYGSSARLRGKPFEVTPVDPAPRRAAARTASLGGGSDRPGQPGRTAGRPACRWTGGHPAHDVAAREAGREPIRHAVRRSR